MTGRLGLRINLSLCKQEKNSIIITEGEGWKAGKKKKNEEKKRGRRGKEEKREINTHLTWSLYGCIRLCSPVCVCVCVCVC